MSEGVISRQERYGYLALATHRELRPQQFVRVSSYDGERRVEFDVERRFDLDTGHVVDTNSFD